MLVIIVSGIAVGCVYALTAIGYSLIYATTGIVNFGQGAFVMLGGMFAVWGTDRVGMPTWAAAFVAVVLTALVGLALWVLVVLPLWRRDASPFIVIMGTLVFMLLAGSLVLKWLGSDPHLLPAWTAGFDVSLGGARLDGQYIWVIAVSLLLVFLVGRVIASTMLGKSMRASRASRDTSRLLGINPEFVGAVAMLGTAAIGAVGGLLIAPAKYTSYDVGLVYGIYGFIAAIIGGLGSIRGALLGGIIVGLVQVLVSRYVSTTYGTFLTYVILLTLLAIRPHGLLRTAHVEASVA